MQQDLSYLNKNNVDMILKNIDAVLEHHDKNIEPYRLLDLYQLKQLILKNYDKIKERSPSPPISL
jgi:hypothetical protein